MERPSIAIIDDYQSLALSQVDWSSIAARADITVFTKPLRDENEIADKLAPFSVIVLLRERTAFPARLIERLPNLKMIAMTGNRASTLDLAACAARGILVSHTDATPSFSTPELAFALMLACARSLPRAHANAATGRWQEGLPLGVTLAGKRLGIVGLGRLGSRVAHYGKAFDMDVVAWSTNLTDEKAASRGVKRVDKHTLFETSDVISVHLGLSERSRGIIGAPEFEVMKQGAIFVNTSRGALVDDAALLTALRSGRIVAGLDVFDVEPLPAGHPLTTLPNVVLTPHLGFVVAESFRNFYTQSVENILAYLDGAPIRISVA